MQIVIDIDEKRFRDIQRISTVQLKRRTPTLEQVIANGTPLPKGHGRLFDERDIVNGNHEIIGNKIYEVEPIIEADKDKEKDVEKDVCKDCYYNDGEVHAECVICDKTDKED